mgnify:CR=1 FL=1
MRTVMELQGIPCGGLEENKPKQKWSKDKPDEGRRIIIFK